MRQFALTPTSLFSRSGDNLSWEERDALARAEYLCDEAEALHRESAELAAKVVADAKAEAARLLREAIAAIDEHVARSEAARAKAEASRDAAHAARVEAERLLASARQSAAIDLRSAAPVGI
jgi:hypothetical protein